MNLYSQVQLGPTHPAVTPALDLLHVDQSKAKLSFSLSISVASKRHTEQVYRGSLNRLWRLRKRPPVMPEERNCEFKFICKLAL